MASRRAVISCYKRKTGGDVELVVGTPTDFVQKVMATRDPTRRSTR